MHKKIQDVDSRHLSFSGYQKFIVAVLAFLQFTVILDFMILSPLGAFLMPALKITPSQFAAVVSAYAFCAGGAGLLAAGFADRFDRKKLLLFFYSGFVLGTLFCGIAPSYHFLLFARMFTGLFGGVVGSIVFAITTDLFPLQMRGRVMGVVQTAFAASQVMGIPLGLFLSNHFGWHAPFLMIVGASLLVGILIVVYMKPIDAHLQMKQEHSPFRHLVNTVSKVRYLQGFATTALLSTGGFMLMPFSSAFSVNNLKVPPEKLPFVYMTTGLVSMLAGPLIGKASDKFGKFRIFVFGCAVTVATVSYYTNMGESPLPLVMFVNGILFIGISSRMISSSALISALPDPVHRGSYMSVSSSIQSISGGVASIIAGMIVIQTATGKIENFNVIGHVVIGATLVTMVMMYFINSYLVKRPK